jgi:gluconolactonase
MDGITIIDEKFRSYVLPNAPLEKLGEGYRWLEGPVWFSDMDCLLVSDIPNDRILRWTEEGGVSVFRKPSHFANGHTRDKQGRLIGCSHHDRCIKRTELDGTITTLVDRYQGKRLNSPNDVIVKSDGTIWFTDPTFGINIDYEGGKQKSETAPGVYCFDPVRGTLKLVIDDIKWPNGLCFSPDEKYLYVVSSGEQFSTSPDHSIRVYNVVAKGHGLTKGRFFHKVDNGQADGLRMDVDGNIWAAAGDGIHCINSQGNLLGKILVPYPCANLAFGGRNNSRLFICGSHTLYAIYTNTRGVLFP